MQMPKIYNPNQITQLSESQIAELEALKKMSDDEIDYSDAPALTDEQIANAHFYYAVSLKLPKTDIHTKIDNDNLEWLKKDGKGYQTRLNAVIRWARLNGCPISKLG